MMELTTSAARLQRPIARTRPVCSVADKPCLYHSGRAVSYQQAMGQREICRDVACYVSRRVPDVASYVSLHTNQAVISVQSTCLWAPY
jgi:hypothetical protein